MIALLIVAGFALTLILILVFRAVAGRSTKLLDIPNERSSHTTPVVRGAGIAIVVAFLGIYSMASGQNANLQFVMIAASIALLGFVDDLFSLSAALRLAIQLGLVTLFVVSTGSYAGLDSLGHFAPIATVLAITWILNAFNFMDGIDGIAGAQALGTAFAWMLIGMSGEIASFWILGSTLVGCSIAFLVFNWPPAKVFMGDVGSTFLGFVFASMPLLESGSPEQFPITALIPLFLWLFVFDTAYTRLRQIASLQPFWRAHRDHLYQRIRQNGYSPAIISGFFFGFTLFSAFLVLITSTIGWIPVLFLLVFGASGLILWAGKKV